MPLPNRPQHYFDTASLVSISIHPCVTQLPLQEMFLYCQFCEEEESSWFPKAKKCPTDGCEEVLEPWNRVKCPKCKFLHEWAEDLKTVSGGTSCFFLLCCLKVRLTVLHFF